RGLAGIDPSAKRHHHRGHIGRGLAVKFDLVHTPPPAAKTSRRLRPHRWGRWRGPRSYTSACRACVWTAAVGIARGDGASIMLRVSSPADRSDTKPPATRHTHALYYQEEAEHISGV